MAEAYFTPEFAAFFAELEQNNHKAWFDANKKRYEQHVKQPMERLVAHYLDHLLQLEPHFQPQPLRSLIFRIYRDTRFSKDKTPYKTHLGAYFNPRGKNATGPGYYFQLNHSGLWAGCGIYEPDPATTKRIRAAIAAHPAEFASRLDSPAFREWYGPLQGERAKVLPKEWKAVAEREPRIAHKQFYCHASRPVEFCLQPALLPALVEMVRAAKPYHDWLTAALA